MATDTFYADAADGQISKSGAVWATQRAAATGDSRDKTSATVNATQVQEFTSTYYIDRGFLTFDTSTIPDHATITAATLNIYANSKASSGLSDSLCIVESTQASGTDLTTADFDAVGSTELATRVAHSSISTAAYTSFALNSSGLAVISKTGFSKFALRSARDLDNSAPGSGTYAILNINCSEQTATSKDPYLEVTYDTSLTKTFTADAIIQAQGVTTTHTADAIVLPDRWADTLTGTNGTNLESHTPTGPYAGADPYGTWSQHYPTAGFARLRINSNKIYSYTSAAIPTTSYYTHSLSEIDGTLTADFTIPGAHNDGGYGVLMLRQAGSSGATSDAYQLYFSNGGYVTAGTLRLDKTVASGAAVSLGNYTIGTLSPGTTYTVSLVVSSFLISVKLNGQTVIGPVTDTDVSAKGKILVGISAPDGSSTTTGVQIDNILLEPAPTGITHPFTADAIVAIGPTTKTYTADGIVLGTNTTTYTADGSVVIPGSKTFTADGIINGTSYGVPEIRTTYGSQQTIESPGTTGTNDAWHGGASIVHVPDGTEHGRLISCWLNWVGQPFTYNPTPAGWDDGIWASESTDGGTTWGTPYQMIAGLTAPDKNCIAHLTYDAGRDKLLLYYYDIIYRGAAPGASVPYDGALNANQCHYRECANVSEGGTTWSTDRILDGDTGFTASDAGTGDGSACPHNLIVLPNGDYLLSLYGRNSVSLGYNTTHTRIMRSTDGGANWTALGVIALSSQTNNLMNAEPAIVRLNTGRILAVLRVQDAVSGGSGDYFSCYSDDSGATWSTPVDMGFSVSGPNMPALYQTVSGDVLLATNPPAGASGILVHQSNDNGATWTDAVTISPADGGPYLGAMFCEASEDEGDGNVMVAWCEEASGNPGTAGLWGDPLGPYTVGGQAIIRGWTKFVRLTGGTSFEYVQRTATYTADAIVYATGGASATKTYTADALITAPAYSKTYTADATVKGFGLTKTYTADVVVVDSASQSSALSWFFRRRRSSMTPQTKTYTVVQPKGTTRTATWTSPTYLSKTEAGIIVVLDVTSASGTGGLTLRINAQDSAGSVSVPLNSAPTAVATAGTTSYALYPFGAISGALTQSTSGYLPREFSISVTHADSSSYTYSVGYCLLP